MMPEGMTPAALWLLLLLGAYHGINPAMGWLFAVSLGLQEQKGSTVVRSLVPIAIGHALAVGSMVAIAAALGMALPLAIIRWLAATILVALGLYYLVRHRHPRWVRMQVGFRDLTLWSFLMASAHGAGLMLIPVLLGGGTAQASGQTSTHRHLPMSSGPMTGLLATGIHTAAYLAVTGLVAWVVYQKLGLAVLRKTWFNVDLVWAVALVAAGLITLLV
jgi:hypothetical protein